MSLALREAPHLVVASSPPVRPAAAAKLCRSGGYDFNRHQVGSPDQTVVVPVPGGAGDQREVVSVGWTKLVNAAGRGLQALVDPVGEDVAVPVLGADEVIDLQLVDVLVSRLAMER